MAEQKDKFANMAFGSTTESGTTTLTFSEINTAISMHEKVAWIIHRIQWNLAYSDINKIVAETDGIVAALTVSNKMTALNLNDPAVIDVFNLLAWKFGTPASAQLYETPFIRRFTDLPGGGLIVPPRPIYVAAQGVSVASAITAECRIFFTTRKLSTEDYWELVEARRMVE